jgi:hypothetical protein
MRPRIYIVEAQKDGYLQYWAAATAPEDASRAVQQHLGLDWKVRLTDRTLRAEYADILSVPAGRVRRVKYMPEQR